MKISTFPCEKRSNKTTFAHLCNTSLNLSGNSDSTIMKLSFILPVMLLFLACVSCSPSKKTTAPSDDKSNVSSKKIREPYHATVTKMHDLVHTSLDVSFDWENQRLYGSATLTIKPHFYPAKELFLDARGMDIREVKLVIGDKYEELAYTYRNDSIGITLDKWYAATDTFKVFIDYVSKPEDLPVGGSSAITSDKGLYFINPDGSDPEKPQQIWTQGETQSSSVWFPTIDKPNQKTTQEIYMTVDTAFLTLSNGKLISSILNTSNGTRTDYWRQDLPHAPYLFMMAVGKFAVVTDTWKGKEISYYVEPEYGPYARNIFGNTPEMMDFFTSLLGVDYPWEKYSQIVVRDYVSGAMENTTATVFGEFMQKDARGLLDGSNEEVVSHELFHQWFGNIVTCESWSNLPLNESFATYGEYLWNEYKYGRDEADYSGQNDLFNYLREARNKQVDLVRFQYDVKEQMFDNHSYAKGGRVLHMLRKYTGDAAFFASLKLYLESNKFKAVEMHNLRLAFEEVTGEDLNWFFNQWFFDKGHPSLKIDYEYDAVAGKQKVTVQQLQSLETTPLYKLPVVMDFYSGNSVIRKKVVIEKQTEIFEFDFKEKPELVNFDAQKILLGTKTDNHTPEEWVLLFKRGPMYMDRYEALSKVMKTFTATSPEAEIVRLALSDPHWNIRMLAVRNSKPLIAADRENMKQQLMQLAKNDHKSAVRDEALTILSEQFPKDAAVNQLMRNAINDSSYIVMETAITHILDNNLSEGLGLLKSMEKDENENIMEMVSGLYKLYGGDEQYEYMTGVLLDTRGYSKYTAVQNYGKYLLRCKPKVAMAGIDRIAAIGNNYPQWMVRLSAVQTLSEISKSYGKTDSGNPGGEISKPGDTVLNDRMNTENESVRKKAEEMLIEIKSKEKDLNLLKIYNKAP